MDRATSDALYHEYRLQGCPNKDVDNDDHWLRFNYRNGNHSILKRIYCWDCDFEVVF